MLNVNIISSNVRYCQLGACAGWPVRLQHDVVRLGRLPRKETQHMTERVGAKTRNFREPACAVPRELFSSAMPAVGLEGFLLCYQALLGKAVNLR